MINKNALIETLLDSTSSDAEKDDAAIELSEFNDREVIDVLIKISNDPKYNEIVKASCGESLASIWLKQQKINYDDFAKLNGIAFHEALELIKQHRKEWLNEFKKLFPEKARLD